MASRRHPVGSLLAADRSFAEDCETLIPEAALLTFELIVVGAAEVGAVGNLQLDRRVD